MASNSEIVEKRCLSDLVDSIRSKFQALKQKESNFQVHQERYFKPILTKMKEYSEKTQPKPTSDNSFSNEQISQLLTLGDDKVFGIKKFDGIWYLGTFPVRFTPTEIYVGEDKSFKTSRGFISLLTRKEPTGYSSSDLDC